MPELSVQAASSILKIPSDRWDDFGGSATPFTRHSFLSALESSGCTTAETGWAPHHLTFRLEGEIVGFAPAYLKQHSMGEYVFDWAWADAYQRHGLDYYPKLLVAVPFSPVQGPRLLLAPQYREQLTATMVHDALDRTMAAAGAHSWHLLFPDAHDQALLEGDTSLHRLGCQFHWHNRGYHTFDDFLATLTSRKRKSIRRERRQVGDQDIHFQHYSGLDLPESVLRAFYQFYQATYYKRGQRPYLNLSFFQTLGQQQPEQLHVIMAEKDGDLIAGALFLMDDETLYGRYWGCLAEYHHLHFETCYYQGIELAIARGLTRFDAGAQGEHKLIRGFEPTFTHSWHNIAHPDFRHAIARFCREEMADVQAYREEALTLLPFRQD